MTPHEKATLALHGVTVVLCIAIVGLLAALVLGKVMLPAAFG